MARSRPNLEEIAPAAPPTDAPEVAPLRKLPDKRSEPDGRLESKVILLYGPPKVGKSTLVSEMGDVLFADVEGGLSDLSVFKEPVHDWVGFLEVCAAAVQSKRFTTLCVDTVDILSAYCSAYTNAKMGVAHESDLEWGKGWQVKREEFQRPLAKLAATPGLGLVLISHAKDVEIKTRSRVITKAVPTVSGPARDIAINMADLVLYADFEENADGEEMRVLRTKPSAYYEAGERGNPPRLPATLPLSWDALRAAWYGGDMEEANGV